MINIVANNTVMNVIQMHLICICDILLILFFGFLSIKVSIGSRNGLLPNGDKPFLKAMLVGALPPMG